MIATLEGWYSKVPSLPASVKEFIVTITPWLALIFGVLGILGSIAGLGLLTALSPFAVFSGASGVSSIGSGFLAALVWLVSSILLVVAFPGARVRKIGGWNMLFWSEVVHFVGSIVALSIISGIIVIVIALYFLFQIKPYYK